MWTVGYELSARLPLESLSIGGGQIVLRTNVDGSRQALFSECDKYRYTLWIVWDRLKPMMANIGLNPSKATEEINDPTVTRDMTRAADLGFGSLLKLNLFPFRATDPKEMKAAADPYGEWRNPERIIHTLDIYRPKMIVAAWGNHGTHLGRSDAFREVAREAGLELYAYRITKEREPQHSLYLPYEMNLERYEY